jgi:F0F1-type ATP synthase membrane subunit b/b'
MTLETRVNTLEADVLAMSQTLTDRLDQHSVRITVAQQDADNAQAQAVSALTQIYQTGLDAQLYTDQQIQQLRDDFNAMVSALDAGIPDQVKFKVESDLARVNADLEQARNELAASTEQIRVEVEADLDSIRTANDELLNTYVPGYDNQIADLDNEAISLRASIQTLTTGMAFPSVVEEIDQVTIDFGSQVDGVLQDGKDTILDTAIVLSKEQITEGTKSIRKTGNPSFEEGWTGWFTLPGTTTDILGERDIKTGSIEGDDTDTIYQQDVKITILEHLTTGQRLIEGF